MSGTVEIEDLKLEADVECERKLVRKFNMDNAIETSGCMCL